jgi:hypothetical protein
VTSVSGTYFKIDKQNQTVEKEVKPKLEALAGNAHQALKGYLDYLSSLSDV